MRKTPGEFAYESWCRNAGIEPKTMFERARDNHNGTIFVELMDNHTMAGFFRYGSLKTYRDNPIDFKAKIDDCWDRFEKEGNIEHLVDIGNWARIAFHYAPHKNRHYTTADKKRTKTSYAKMLKE